MSEQTASSSQVKISWVLWTLLAFTIFAVIGAYSLRMTDDYTGYDQKRETERYATLKKLRDESSQTLTSVDWVDQGKGIVRIPIEEAMAHEVSDLKAQPVALGCPIVVPAPAPAATTNAAPSAPAKEKK